MATTDWPDWLIPTDCRINWVKAGVQFRNPYSGKLEGLEFSSGRWVLSLTLTERALRDAGRVEAYLFDLAGGSNRTRAWHFRTKGVPRGTMRGAPTLHAAAVRGDKVITIDTEPGATLAHGDMIGCTQQLFQSAADCVADGSGVMTVPLVNRVRASMALGAAISWSRPTAQFVLPSFGGIVARPGKVDGASVDLEEVW